MQQVSLILTGEELAALATAADARVKALETRIALAPARGAKKTLLEHMRVLLAARKKLNQAQVSRRTTSKSLAIN